MTFSVLFLLSLTLRDNTTNTANSANLLLASSRAERATIDLETGIRGALLTDNSDFLQPYREGLASLKEQQANLEKYSDTEFEDAQVAGLNAELNRYVNEFAEPAAAMTGTLTESEKKSDHRPGKVPAR